MSERLPRLTAKEIIRVLGRHGFVFSRSSGSHHIYKNATATAYEVRSMDFDPVYTNCRIIVRRQGEAK